MATVFLSPIGNGFQFLDANAVPLNGGTLSTYFAGSSTPQPTYTTSAGSIQNPTSITLAADGRPPNEIWMVSGIAYKFVLRDALSNVLGTYDNLYGINDPFFNLIGPTDGTFVPVLTFGGLSTGITYGSRTGQYVQIPLLPGKFFTSMVYFWGQILLSSKGSATGNAQIENLPFAISANYTPSANTPNGILNTNDVTFADKFITLSFVPGAAKMTITSVPSAAPGPNFIADTGFANDSSLFFSGFYPT